MVPLVSRAGPRPDRPGVDPVGLQRGELGPAGVVVADRAAHHHRRPGPRRGHGRVGPLAAGDDDRAVADHGLAGARAPLGPHDDVLVDPADHDQGAGVRVGVHQR